MRRSVLNSRFLQSSAILAAVASAAAAGPASAQQANLTAANVNVLDLLSPFLTLNSTPIGQQTLQVNLSQAVAINQNEFFGGAAQRQSLDVCTGRPRDQ